MPFKERGFTLIEMLVALAVTAAIAAIGFAGWATAVQRAKRAACLSNLRTIAGAVALYANDNDNRLPGTQHQRSSWVSTLQPYLGTRKVYRCPLDPSAARPYSYAVNDVLVSRPAGSSRVDYSRRSNIPCPSLTLYMTECADHYKASDHFHLAEAEEEGLQMAAIALETQVAGGRHREGAHYLFVDGHIELLTPREAARRASLRESRFIHPDP